MYRLLSLSQHTEIAETGYLFQLTLGRKLSNSIHCHDFYEIICILSGKCGHVVSGHRYEQTVGNLVFLRPGDTHWFDSQTEGTSVAAISVSAAEMNGFIHAYGLEKDSRFLPTVPYASDLPPAMIVFDSLSTTLFSRTCSETLLAEPSRRRDYCKYLVGQVIGKILLSARDENDSIPTYFSNLLSAMNIFENAVEGLPAFLRLANVSHSQLCRLTKQHLGMSPVAYINRVRMKYAWEMETSGLLSHETIGETIGFYSYRYYRKLFHDTYGLSPAEARTDFFRQSSTL